MSSADFDVVNAGKIHKTKDWKPPPVGWFKRNTGSSRIQANGPPRLVISIEIARIVSCSMSVKQLQVITFL